MDILRKGNLPYMLDYDLYDIVRHFWDSQWVFCAVPWAFGHTSVHQATQTR